jgi:hypothetical protein
MVNYREVFGGEILPQMGGTLEERYARLERKGCRRGRGAGEEGVQERGRDEE